MAKYKENTVTCLKCNQVLEAPKKDRDINQCKCKNRTWIQKRPDGEFWAYGSVDPLQHTRNKILNGN